MKQMNFLFFVIFLGRFSVANPLNPEIMPKHQTGLESSNTALPRRDDVPVTCPVPEPFSIINNFRSQNLPPRWQIAFGGGALAGNVLRWTAYEICRAVEGQPPEHAPSCKNIGLSVGGVVTAGLTGVILYHTGGLTGAASQTSSAKRGDLLAVQMEASLRARGVEFDTIFDTPLVTRGEVRGHSLEILRVRSPGSDNVMDHKLQLRDNHTGVAMAVMSPSIARHDSHTGPGFRVSY
jgi:hypothetical protein